MSGGLATRCVSLLVSLLAAASLGASERATADAWIRGIFTGNSPRPVEVTDANAWDQAQAAARASGDALVVLGSGRSMQPLYPSGTVLVLRPIAYEKLRPGQTAVYRNQATKAVAHVLVTRTRDGWRARGLNNRQHDMEPVRPGNLVGVVVAAYLPTRLAAAKARSSPVYFLADQR
jgi:hypothetical protein